MVKKMSFPILQRLIVLLGVQPSRPTVRFQRTPIQKAYHKERYDFSDGYGALQTLAEEMAKGEVKAVPKASWEPDFGSWSAPSAIRSITQGKPQPPSPEYFSLLSKQETYDFGSWSRRPNLSETQPLFYSQYEPSPIDFGEGCSRRRYHAYLEPQVLPSPKSEIDFGMSGARLAPENIPRESFQEFMFGDVKRQSPQPQLTIKSSANLKKTEKYDFGISF
jgi:hypothetical protein